MYNYNPYMNQFNGFQMPQYQPYQNTQANYQQAQQNATQPVLAGQMVDSLETARAKDVDMSGAPRYYPNINGTEIYVKQLQADGTCPTVVFKREHPEPVPDPNSEALNRIYAELEAIKSMMDQKPKGGAKA